MSADAFATLLSPFRLGNVEVRNRIVSTAHGTYMLRDGMQTDQIAAYHSARAQGGTGLIILEATSTHPTGIGSSQFAVAHTDECIPGYRMVIDAVHAHGTPAFVQLYHPGRDDIAGMTDDGTVAPAYSAWSARCETNQIMPRTMSPALIREVVASYGDAAKRLVLAGADGLEISAHHGHLIAQFLDLTVNRRTDEYGGSFANRFRILAEIVESVRNAIGDGVALGVRLTSGEGSAVGINADEGLEAAVATDGLDGVDFIHITPGSTSTFDGWHHVVAPMNFPSGYARQDFGLYRSRLRKPLMVTGRINDPAVAESLLRAGADMVGMTRALICDPELPNKVRAGRPDDVRACIGCNQACIGHGRKGAMVSCIQNPAAGRERVFGRAQRATHVRKVLVAGGGPAGMKAAAVAAERGHDVTLYERGSRLGGQARLAEMLPARAEFGGLITNLESELRRFRVTVVRNQGVTRELIEAQAPDAVIVATGATRNLPPFPGAEEAAVVHAWDVVSGTVQVGSSVVIVDETLDWVALGVAEKLAREGRVVRLCALGYTAADNTPSGVKGYTLGLLHSLGVQITPLMRIGGFSDNTAFFQHATSGETVTFENVDTLVMSCGGVPDMGLETELAGYAGKVHVIGDCLAPRTAEEAVFEGLKAGWGL